MLGLSQLPGSSVPCTACCAVPRPFGSAPWAAVSLCWSAVTQPAQIAPKGNSNTARIRAWQRALLSLLGFVLA